MALKWADEASEDEAAPEAAAAAAAAGWRSVPALFEAARARGQAIALREKRFGIWRGIGWADYGERAQAVGLGLAALGVQRGERIAICAENRPEWLYADLGALGVGAVSVGIYATSAPAQIRYIVDDCAARVYFAEDEEQLDKCLAVRDELASLMRIVVFETKGLGALDDPDIMSLDELIELGRAHGRSHPDLWRDAVAAAAPEDLAILIYTSGTTGPPKGAMISHRNILFQVEMLSQLIPQGPSDELFSFLPLSHIVERVFTNFRPLASGAAVNFAESPETVPENLREVAPTILFAVPRVWEKLYSGIVLALAEATAFEKWAYRIALGLGHRAAAHRVAGRAPPPGLRLAAGLARALVLGNIRRLLGLDRARLLFSGAAPIAPDLIRWYHALGLDMREGYGQTENTAVATFHGDGANAVGTVGQAAPGTELRLADDGEVLLRGPHVFMGYYGRPEKTAETVRDGWLYTGDVGELDEAGNLRITDRKSDIIVTAGGKNITPSEIENQLKFGPFISDAVVIGERRRYLTCLVMIDHKNVARYAQDHGVPFTSFASLTRAEAVRELIGGEIEKVNGNLARVETIKRFSLIETELTPEDDELTPTMKLRRKLVNEKYRDVIESMYRDAT